MMTAPSPRLRTAWRVGSALAAAAGSAVVTSALVNRSRSRSQRKTSPEGSAEDLPAAAPPGHQPADPLEAATSPTSPPQVAATPAAAPPPEVAASGGGELLVHDPQPGRPRVTPSDGLARAIRAADAIEAAPTSWARGASELRSQTTAADTGWSPSTAALAGAEPIVAPPPGTSPAPLPPTGPETPPGTPAINGSAAWDYGLSGVDTRVPRLPGEPDRRKPRRLRHRDAEPEAPADPTAAAAAAAAATAAAPARSNGAGTEAAIAAAAPTTAPAPPTPPTAPPAGPGPGDDVTPDRRMLMFIGIAVAVAVLLGIGFVVVGGGGDDDSPESAADRSATQGTDGNDAAGSQPPATPLSQLTPDQAFAQAAQRLSTAGSFAYSGSSSATDVSPVRPGPWLAVNLSVQGHVQLGTSRLFERGTADDGSVVETTTDGATIWGRSAASFDGLQDVPIGTVYTLPPPNPAKVGALLLPQWLEAETGAVPNGTDDQGRTTFKATLPAAVLGTIQDDVAPVDATMVLALDQSGDPVHLEVSTPDGGAPLRLVFEIADLGEQTPIPIPGEEPATTGSGTGGSPTTGATVGQSTGATGATTGTGNGTGNSNGNGTPGQTQTTATP
jgi:hypothetical protein